MRGLNPQIGVQPIAQQGSLIPAGALGQLLGAYLQSQGKPGASLGATGTEYAPSQSGPFQPSESVSPNGAGYGLGNPLIAGGQSGQPSMPQVDPRMQSLLDAMTQARSMGR